MQPQASFKFKSITFYTDVGIFKAQEPSFRDLTQIERSANVSGDDPVLVEREAAEHYFAKCLYILTDTETNSFVTFTDAEIADTNNPIDNSPLLKLKENADLQNEFPNYEWQRVSQELVGDMPSSTLGECNRRLDELVLAEFGKPFLNMVLKGTDGDKNLPKKK